MIYDVYVDICLIFFDKYEYCIDIYYLVSINLNAFGNEGASSVSVRSESKERISKKSSHQPHRWLVGVRTAVGCQS